MNVLITGSNGFIGSNLRLWLCERRDVGMFCFDCEQSLSELGDMLERADFVFHLAGINRPQDPQDFATGNANLTQALCDKIGEIALRTGKIIPVVFTSSIQAERGNPYGHSKLLAESSLFELQRTHGVPVYVFRLPNVFGKWCKPNYNSAVATFCHNIARDLPIQIYDHDAPLLLVYVDDVIACFLGIMDDASCRSFKEVAVTGNNFSPFQTVKPEYATTVGAVAKLLKSFKESRNSLVTERVGIGLLRALYATYVSYLPPEDFAYPLTMHSDHRGIFAEMLKTSDCGQFSFFTAHPGVTRGGHYHHSKTEKFLVLQGEARFQFRHMDTGEHHEITTSGANLQIVDTVPGWTHDITNIGQSELIVMLWANEVFDSERPDTYAHMLSI